MKLLPFVFAMMLSASASAITLECTVVDGSLPESPPAPVQPAPTPTPPPVAQPSPTPSPPPEGSPYEVVVSSIDPYRNFQYPDDRLTDGVVAYKFTTKSSTAYGVFNNAIRPGGKYRTAWISKHPGNPDLDGLGRACFDGGYELSLVRWKVGNPVGVSGCQLQPNTTYYYNVKMAHESNLMNNQCSKREGCPYFIQVNFKEE